jgi:hypothetical protein
MSSLIGSGLNQVPSNTDLGTMAYCDVRNYINLTTPANLIDNKSRFPNTLAVVTTTTGAIQKNESHNIGLLAEGVANSTDPNVYGIGLYGVGYTAGATRSGGVVGEGHVSATGDSGSAIGIRGYSTDTHAGGMNIGLYGNAANGVSNYALYMSAGDIFSATAQTWTLGGTLTLSGGDLVTGGNLTIKPSASITPTVNGTVTFEATSNTSLTIKMKGTDGIVRSTTLTLAP